MHSTKGRSLSMVSPVCIDSTRAPRDSDYVDDDDLNSWINLDAFEDDAKLTDQPSTETGKGNDLAQPEAFQCNPRKWASGELLSEFQSELGIADKLLSELQSAPMQRPQSAAARKTGKRGYQPRQMPLGFAHSPKFMPSTSTHPNPKRVPTPAPRPQRSTTTCAFRVARRSFPWEASQVDGTCSPHSDVLGRERLNPIVEAEEKRCATIKQKRKSAWKPDLSPSFQAAITPEPRRKPLQKHWQTVRDSVHTSQGNRNLEDASRRMTRLISTGSNLSTKGTKLMRRLSANENKLLESGMVDARPQSEKRHNNNNGSKQRSQVQRPQTREQPRLVDMSAKPASRPQTRGVPRSRDMSAKSAQRPQTRGEPRSKDMFAPPPRAKMNKFCRIQTAATRELNEQKRAQEHDNKMGEKWERLYMANLRQVNYEMSMCTATKLPDVGKALHNMNMADLRSKMAALQNE